MFYNLSTHLKNSTGHLLKFMSTDLNFLQAGDTLYSDDDINLCWIGSETTLPAGLRFYAKGYIDLSNLICLPADTTITADGNIQLDSVSSILAGTKITAGGILDLSKLTSLIAGVTLVSGNRMDLRNVTAIAPGVTLTVGCSLDLDNLSTLPAGTNLNVGGCIYINNITTLPAGTKLTAGSDIELRSLTTIQTGTVIAAGADINLHNLTTLQPGTKITAGGYIDLNNLSCFPEGASVRCGSAVLCAMMNKGFSNFVIPSSTYVELWLDVKEEHVILYKRVSADFKTQEDTPNETLWTPGKSLECPNWNPEAYECGPGKFHGCARPEWCDVFRSALGDKYIAIRVHIDDLHQWLDTPEYPQKIAFRKGTVISEVDRSVLK